MNKAITVMLIVLGVLIILLFPSLHLEGGNVILFLISVFVIGFMGGGFANLDSIIKANQDAVFYQRETSRKNAIIQDITLQKDKLEKVDRERNADILTLAEMEDRREGILRQYRGMEDNIDMTSINEAIENLRSKIGFRNGK